MRLVATYIIGLIFGLGIAVSGMINPAKVLNFFDPFGQWDASLMFVMGGALATTFVGYRLVFGRKAPVFDSSFHLPTKNRIDAKLLGGSALFGVGWGIAGFCPGAALPALGTARGEVLLFTGALIAGIYLAKALKFIAARGAQTA